MQLYLDHRGYFMFCDSGTLFHSWVMEKKIGRKLLATEVVHHIDRNKMNIYPDNLFLCNDQTHHDNIHRMDAIRYGWKVSLYGSAVRA